MFSRISKLFYVFSLFCLALIFSNSANSQSLPLETARALQDILNNTKDSFNLIGITVAVSFPNYDTWTGASGFSDRNARINMEPDNLMRIASITKTFVAATVLKLSEEGLLALEDSVEKWFPGLVPNGDKITIRHLLNHTSGIFNYTDDFESDLNKSWKPDELVKWSVEHPPEFAPGTNWKYSSTGYFILGMIIEKATNSTLEKEIRKRFLDPLKLNDTFLDGHDKIAGKMTHGYSQILGEVVNLPIAIVTSAWSGSGMVSTAENIARWCKSLYSGKVLKQDSMKQMFSLINNYYGLGVMRLSCPMGEYYGHTGWIFGFESLMGYFQNNDVSLVVLVNQDDKGIFNIYNAISSKIPNVLNSLPKIEIPTTTVDVSGKLSTMWGRMKMEDF